MNHPRTLALLSLLLAPLACGGDTTELPTTLFSTAPDAWTEYSTTCGFTFRGPADLAEVQVAPGDSCVAEFETASCRLLADYGGYSNDLSGLSDMPDYAAQSTIIDGRDATLVTVTQLDNPRPHLAAVHFPEVEQKPGNMLTVWISCDDGEARDALGRSINTIRFP